MLNFLFLFLEKFILILKCLDQFWSFRPKIWFFFFWRQWRLGRGLIGSDPGVQNFELLIICKLYFGHSPLTFRSITDQGSHFWLLRLISQVYTFLSLHVFTFFPCYFLPVLIMLHLFFLGLIFFHIEFISLFLENISIIFFFIGRFVVFDDFLILLIKHRHVLRCRNPIETWQGGVKSRGIARQLHHAPLLQERASPTSSPRVPIQRVHRWQLKTHYFNLWI